MNDLISRQAAIEIVNRYDKSHMVLKQRPMLGAASIVIELGDLPSAQPMQWIPCERELPEDYTDVLAWFEYFRYGNYNCLYQTYGIGSYSMEYDSWMINHETGWSKLRVIAWMPLPEPYAEGGTDK